VPHQISPQPVFPGSPAPESWPPLTHKISSTSHPLKPRAFNMCGDVATPNLYAVAQQYCLQAPDTRTTVMGRRSGSSSSNDDVERAGPHGLDMGPSWMPWESPVCPRICMPPCVCEHGIISVSCASRTSCFPLSPMCSIHTAARPGLFPHRLLHAASA